MANPPHCLDEDDDEEFAAPAAMVMFAMMAVPEITHRVAVDTLWFGGVYQSEIRLVLLFSTLHSI